MAMFHCSIKIISRASGRSAVASAAYRSGEKLYNDETGITHDFTKKGGVVFSEICILIMHQGSFAIENIFGMKFRKWKSVLTHSLPEK